MRPTVSVCRKGDDLYLTLEGDFTHVSSQELLQALKRLVMTSLKCFAADSPVAFSFKTHGKVTPRRREVMGKGRRAPLAGWSPRRTVRSPGRREPPSLRSIPHRQHGRGCPPIPRLRDGPGRFAVQLQAFQPQTRQIPASRFPIHF